MAEEKKAPVDATAGELFAGFAQDKKRSGKLPVLAGLSLGAVALVYAGIAVSVAGEVPEGATVAGVEIGGMEPEAAVKKLDAELGSALDKPFSVRLKGKTAQLDPGKAGLKPDFGSTVHQMADFSLNPVKIAAHLVGESEIPLETTVEKAKLTAALNTASPELKTAPTEASFTCVGQTLQPVKPATGSELDVNAAVAQVATRWWQAAGDRGQALELPATITQPYSNQKQLDEAAAGIAKTLVSAPIQLTAGDQKLEIPVTELCAAAKSWKLQEQKLAVSLDGERLRKYLLENTQGLETEPVAARFEFVNDKPTVVPSRDGAVLEAKEISVKVTAGAISAQNRAVTVDLTPKPAEFSTDDANNAGIKEVIGEFDTPLTAEPMRTGNLIRGAGILTGLLFKPGETFSLEKALGEITAANGWAASGVIENGFHTTALGGGLSQLSTTTLNAAWFAGMDLLEFTPHSEYITRYPAGRESTLWTGSIDLKWKNPNPDSVLLQGWVAGGRLHMRIWGTKYYEVKSVVGPRTNVRPTKTVVNNSPLCVPSGAGQAGFTISNTRIRYLEGKEFDRKTYTHSYHPANNIQCAKDLEKKKVQEKKAVADKKAAASAKK